MGCEYFEAVATGLRGLKIAQAFKKEEKISAYQTIALLNLYEQKSYSRQELKTLVGIGNEGSFNRSVLDPLKDRGLVLMGDGKAFQHKAVFISEKGENLVERVLRGL